MSTGSFFKESSHFWWIPGLLALIFVQVISFDGLYGQDSFEYLRYSEALHSVILGDPCTGIFSWPVLYPLIGALLSFLLTTAMALQIDSIACYALAGMWMEKILRKLYPERPGTTRLYTLLFFSLSPFFLRYSLTVMSDVMAISMICGSYYAYLLYLERSQPVHFFWQVLSGAAAIFTRYPAAVILLIPLLHASIRFLARFRVPWFLGIAAGAASLLALELLLHGRMVESVAGKASLEAWSVLNYFRSSFDTADGRLVYSLPNFTTIFRPLVHPGFLFAGLILLPFLRRKDLSGSFRKAVWASYGLYTLFVAGLSLQNDRLLLMTLPLVIIACSGPLFRWTASWNERRQGFLIISVCGILIVQSALFWRAFRPFYQNNRMARFLAGVIREYPGKNVYSFNVDAALVHYGVTSKVISLYADQEGRFEAGALVLFNPSASFVQWQGHGPMINWEELVAHHHLKLVKRLPDGWILCEIGD